MNFVIFASSKEITTPYITLISFIESKPQNLKLSRKMVTTEMNSTGETSISLYKLLCSGCSSHLIWQIIVDLFAQCCHTQTYWSLFTNISLSVPYTLCTVDVFVWYDVLLVVEGQFWFTRSLRFNTKWFTKTVISILKKYVFSNKNRFETDPKIKSKLEVLVRILVLKYVYEYILLNLDFVLNHKFRNGFQFNHLNSEQIFESELGNISHNKTWRSAWNPYLSS